MKMIKYLFFILFPIVCGCLILVLIFCIQKMNLIFPASIISCVAAFLLLVGWFFIGKNFANDFKSLSGAVFVGNIVGILSFYLYQWQAFTPMQEINVYVARFAQIYFAPLLVVLSLAVSAFGEKAMIAFQNPPYSVFAQIFSLVLMLLVFAYGYSSNKNRKNE